MGRQRYFCVGYRHRVVAMKPRPMGARLGSTRHGTRSWLLQRLTAVYIAGFIVLAAIYFSLKPIADFAAWQALWSAPQWRVAVGVLIGSVLVHSWLGLRSVWMDYLAPTWLRFSVSMLTALGLVLLALWAGHLLLVGPR